MAPGLLFLSEHMLQLSIINSKVAITLHFQLCYPALQMKNTTRRTSAINPVTMENSDNSHYIIMLLGKPLHGASYCESTPCAVSRYFKWDTKEDTGISMHCASCSILLKGTCQNEAMSNSEKSSL